jgi:hypothetical protein
MLKIIVWGIILYVAFVVIYFPIYMLSSFFQEEDTEYDDYF